MGSTTTTTSSPPTRLTSSAPAQSAEARPRRPIEERHSSETISPRRRPRVGHECYMQGAPSPADGASRRFESLEPANPAPSGHRRRPTGVDDRRVTRSSARQASDRRSRSSNPTGSPWRHSRNRRKPRPHRRDFCDIPECGIANGSATVGTSPNPRAQCRTFSL